MQSSTEIDVFILFLLVDVFFFLIVITYIFHKFRIETSSLADKFVMTNLGALGIKTFEYLGRIYSLNEETVNFSKHLSDFGFILSAFLLFLIMAQMIKEHKRKKNLTSQP